MHLTSTINPLSRTDANVPVAVFCYQAQRRFLRVTDNYNETVLRIKDAFGIKAGNTVVLSSSSLDVCKGNEVVIDNSAYPFLWTVLDEVNVIAGETNDREDQVIEENTDHLPTPSVTPVAGPSRQSFSGAELQHNVYEDAEFEPAKETDLGPAGDAEEEAVAEQQDVAMPLEENEYRDDYEPMNPSDEEYFREEQPAEEPAKKKFKPAPTEEPKTESPRVKKEKMREASPPSVEAGSSQPTEIPAKPRAAAGDDSRFEITIHPPGSDDGAKFKLRGKHTVKKVLTAACKTFELDVNRAHLIHSLSVEIDGEFETQDFECPLDDTMALCGIDATAKLFIRLDEEEKHGYDSD